MRTKLILVYTAVTILALVSAFIVNVLSLRVLKFNPVVFVVPISVFIWSMVLRRRRRTPARTIFRAFGIAFLVSSVVSYLVLIALVIAALRNFT